MTVNEVKSINTVPQQALKSESLAAKQRQLTNTFSPKKANSAILRRLQAETSLQPNIQQLTVDKRAGFRNLVQGDELLENTFKDLEAIDAFASNPSLSKYYDLSPSLQNIVAARFTHGDAYWGFTSIETLKERFECSFDSYGVEKRQKALVEAVDIQEKILSVQLFTNLLPRHGNLTMLQRIVPENFAKIKDELKTRFSSDSLSDIQNKYDSSSKVRDQWHSYFNNMLKKLQQGFVEISSYVYTPSF